MQTNERDKLSWKLFNNNFITNLQKLRKFRNFGTEFEQFKRSGERSFDGLQNLKVLSLKKNLFTGISKETLKPVPNLLTLDLSNNSLSLIELGTFDDLTNLTELHLDGNDLTGFAEKLFDSLVQLRTLTVSGNRLFVIAPATFDKLINLEVLSLSDNKLPGIDKELFVNFERLKVLDLSKNLLVKFDVELFNSFANIEDLNVADNRVSAIVPQTFAAMTKLKSLTLSENRIKRLNTDINFPSTLEKLYIDWCSIEEIERNFFENLSNLRVVSAFYNECVYGSWSGDIDFQVFNKCYEFWDNPRDVTPDLSSTTTIKTEPTTGAAAAISSIFLVIGFAAILMKI